MVILICKQCGTEFYSPLETRQYCNKECYVGSQKKQTKGGSKKEILKVIYTKIDELDAKLQVALQSLSIKQLQKIFDFVNKTESKTNKTRLYAFMSRHCNGLSDEGRYY